jgi:hypothetical protein
MRLQPLLLHVEFKSDFEYSKREYLEVLRSIQRWAKPCMHQRRSICFVIVSAETSAELVKRLRPTLDSNTADYRCHPAPIAVVARHGSVDSLVTHVEAAWKEIGERGKPQHMRQSQFRSSERRIDNRQGGAIGQMIVEPRGSGKSPKNFDR